VGIALVTCTRVWSGRMSLLRLPSAWRCHADAGPYSRGRRLGAGATYPSLTRRGVPQVTWRPPAVIWASNEISCISVISLDQFGDGWRLQPGVNPAEAEECVQ